MLYALGKWCTDQVKYKKHVKIANLCFIIFKKRSTTFMTGLISQVVEHMINEVD